MSILYYLLGGVGGALRLAAGAAAGVAFAYLAIVPLERADARRGYVQEDRAIAAEAKLTEVQRQVAAGQIVIASYQEILKNARAKDAADDAQLAKDRAEFEAKVAAAGRAWNLDQSDVDWLLH
ncbi:hypothetical protein NL532_23960 [Mesorhizobium sp. C120A]|uniref:hypothetical protein n=1 Tax=unclassified Mesorhizobium TaxID=325217 RepID=UPI0004250092|nr:MULTISPECIES: hypothetical protein [unclassified Mesorhizobium]WJI43665.1 hypothetical protein NL532_23960 [Mesorhizobium sp. C120A]